VLRRQLPPDDDVVQVCGEGADRERGRIRIAPRRARSKARPPGGSGAPWTAILS